MYYYLIDDRATKASSPQLTQKIRSWIKASQIAGEQLVLHSPQQIIETSKQLAKKNPVPTIVVIGDDTSLDLTISGIQQASAKATVGYIPLQKDSPSALLLGITTWQAACRLLQQRRTKEFHLLSINETVCLQIAQLCSPKEKHHTAQKVTIRINNKLTIATEAETIIVTNALNDSHTEGYDWLLEVMTTNSSTQKVKSTQPLIHIGKSIIKEKPEVIARLEANSATITPSSRILLQNLIPFSGQISIKKHQRAQQVITARDEQIISA